ncbi:hypothetical protein EYC57_22155 [Xanthomonas oryzae]|nr:hypothetical protein EYC57_22155 [Xanthomonas oryzae]
MPPHSEQIVSRICGALFRGSQGPYWWQRSQSNLSSGAPQETSGCLMTCAAESAVCVVQEGAGNVRFALMACILSID